MRERMRKLTESLVDKAVQLGASYAEVRFQEVESSSITVENEELRTFGRSDLAGVGVRVMVDQALGLTASTVLSPTHLGTQVEMAVKAAKAVRTMGEPVTFAAAKPMRRAVRSPAIKSPECLSDAEKIALVMDANKAAKLPGVKNRVTTLAWFLDRRLFTSSEGAAVSIETGMTGLAHTSVASSRGRMESVGDSRSQCSGFEFILDTDWSRFTEEISRRSLQAAAARAPTPGAYEVVADADLIGIILHEAFGHAAEADLVTTQESVLAGKQGEHVASPQVSIVDAGVVTDGYYLPFDDEGVAKRRQVIVEDGVLQRFLHTRETAHKMGVPPSGNARAQDFGRKPIVRQTNLFMERGDQSLDELVEAVDDGLYICGKGAVGGEVDVALGTFTFRAGPSYTIKKGKLGKMVRGVSISGQILDTLHRVAAVGKDVAIRTSVFGGCGKNGQRVRVGYGGPPVRIERLLVGGSG
jgi:TldD protein